MATIGPRAAVDLALPTGIDSTEILKFQLRDGRTAEEQVRASASAIGAVNEQVASYFGGLFYITESLYAYDIQGESSRTMTPIIAEFAKPDAVRGSNIGRMLPAPVPYQDALAWTMRYLRQAPGAQMDADIKLISDRWWNRVGYDLWTRILTNTENAVGSAGYDVPWAIGTGTNVNYIPPQVRGQSAFSSSHTHFVVQNSSASKTYATLFEEQMKELRHHGIGGTLQGYCSFDDLDTIVALSNFVELNPQNIVVLSSGTGTDPVRLASGIAEGMPGELFGYYKSKKYGLLELRYDERIPQYYTFLTKSYGINNPRNGVAIRVEPGIGFGMRPDPQVTSSLVPELDSVFFKADHSVGINDRLNGVCGYLYAGATTWVNPSIS